MAAHVISVLSRNGMKWTECSIQKATIFKYWLTFLRSRGVNTNYLWYHVRLRVNDSHGLELIQCNIRSHFWIPYCSLQRGAPCYTSITEDFILMAQFVIRARTCPAASWRHPSSVPQARWRFISVPLWSVSYSKMYKLNFEIERAANSARWNSFLSAG